MKWILRVFCLLTRTRSGPDIAPLETLARFAPGDSLSRPNQSNTNIYDKTSITAPLESVATRVPRQGQSSVHPTSFEKQGDPSTKQSAEWVSRFLSEDMKAARKKTERETKLELEERLRARKAKERAQLFRPRPLTSFEKFKKIKPTGSRDGYG